MTREEKVHVLLTTARAFVTRGPALQYDQLSMDRTLQITTRRRYTFPPEAATPQQRLYLDCATFICAAYYNAFGYRLEADVTWNIRDLVRDCIFRHDFTGEETPQEIEAMKAQVKSLLQPGDAVVWSKATNGHIMLYVDEHTCYHCTQAGIPGSYDYANRRDNVTQNGGMHIDDPRWWFEPHPDRIMGRNYLFAEGIKAFAVVRPLNHVGEPTADAMARVGSAKDLWFAVTASHSGGQTAQPGDTVEYTLTARNDRTAAASVEISFSAPASCSGPENSTARLTLAPGETASVSFPVILKQAEVPSIDPPVIMANSLHVYAPPVLTGRNLTTEEADRLLAGMEQAVSKGYTTEQAIAEAYLTLGVTIPEHRLLLRDLFHRYDSLQGEILIRRKQTPTLDMAVYSYFGGTGVATPEVACDPSIRTSQLRMEDLQAGDVLLCSDDYTNLRTYAAIYTGTGFLGSFQPDQLPAKLEGQQAAAWLDSLPGRFAYVLLRPSQTM